MPLAVEVLDALVVGVVVGDKEGASDRTTVRIGAVLQEQFAVCVEVEVVHTAVKGDHNHLWHL